MKKFDDALAEFAQACQKASAWRINYWGGAHRTRIDAAFADVKAAYEAACRADEEELNQGE